MSAVTAVSNKTFTVIPPVEEGETLFIVKGSVLKAWANAKRLRSTLEPSAVTAVVEEYLKASETKKLSMQLEYSLTWPQKWRQIREKIRDNERRQVKLRGQKILHRAQKQASEQGEAAAAALPEEESERQGEQEVEIAVSASQRASEIWRSGRGNGRGSGNR